ncbi:MAG: bifunctional DNA-binding transcriptional regulator/O6-methylguanine-DNA methyltransferase Ada [Bryobacteraceae bacterium]
MERSKQPGLDEGACWRAVAARDSAQAGQFYYGVVSTGVYCRPGCPARLPLRANVRFFRTREQAGRAGLRPCKRCHPEADGDARAARIGAVCRYIEDHAGERVTLERLGAAFGLSPFHLQREFKAATGLTPREYADSFRMADFKGRLKQGASVTRAMVDAGYNSSSRLYERTPRELGMTPRQYRRGGEGVLIEYVVVQTVLGAMLVAATEKGLCAVYFGAASKQLVNTLCEEYPAAKLQPGGARTAAWAERIARYLEGKERALPMPVDVTGTAFQHRVWDYLRSIPSGETRTYGDVAAAIGSPAATRAVGSACGRNQVAVVVPCHRVLRSDGALGGYRWGLDRKRKLLERERNVDPGRMSPAEPRA